MSRTLRKVMALGLAGVMALSATGCSSIIADDVTSYPLASMQSKQEIMDYYAASMDYDTVVRRNNEVHEEEYVIRDVSDERYAEIETLVHQAEQVLGMSVYPEGVEKLVSEDVFMYMKATLDDLTLNNGRIDNIGQALGFYFADVTYDISPRTPGSFTQLTTLLGVNGAFVTDPYGNDMLDIPFLKLAVDRINEYNFKNKIAEEVSFDEETMTLMVTIGKIPDGSQFGQPVTSGGLLENGFGSELPEQETLDFGDGTDEFGNPVDGSEAGEENGEGDSGWNEARVDSERTGVFASRLNTDAVETTEDDAEAVVDDAEAVENPETTPDDGEVVDMTGFEGDGDELIDPASLEGEGETEEEGPHIGMTNNGMIYQSMVSDDRKPVINIENFNTVVGSSVRRTAYMPALQLVYNIPEAEGTISGFGLYPAGDAGLRLFGFDRSTLAGTVTLRYVFKESVTGSGEIEGVNIYLSDEQMSSGINVASGNTVIPEFLESQLEQLIERADRIEANFDLSAYMSGNIYEDMGPALKRGVIENYGNTLKVMSTIRNVLNKDSENNVYLLDVETTLMDGAGSADAYGTYRDKSYIVVQQQGDKFVIIDRLRYSRETYKEPQIHTDSVIEKRLIALNLSGDVADADKTDITSLMDDLAFAGTARANRAAEEYKFRGETVTVNRGVMDIFNSDTEMLSTEKRDYLVAQLASQLSKMGADVASDYSIEITEWLGGYENQVEFMTEELINYLGKDHGLYMECYYLVSKMHDEWVIDERRVINSEEYDGNELNSKIEQFK